jgi:hypothetical protein
MTVFLVLLIIALASVDVILTNAILAKGGTELNPFNRFFLAKLGRKWWWAPKMAITLIVAIICAMLPYGWIPLLVFVLVQAGVNEWNVRTLRNMA